MSTENGKLFGVGLGPGDPSLMTLRAVQAIAEADVVAFHSAPDRRSNARAIAAGHLRADHIEEALVYPVTTGATSHPGGYRGAMDDFYEESADRLAKHLCDGRDVAVLCEGDPFLYGSYLHMHQRLASRFRTEVIPGISSPSAAASRLGLPLVEEKEVLTIIPGTLSEDDLVARIAATDSAVIMKLGRTFPTVRRALERAGRLEDAMYVERATMEGERRLRLADVDPTQVPYFAVALLTSRMHRAPKALADTPQRGNPLVADTAGRAIGSVSVVGTGPAGEPWLTPEARGALAGADDLVGYATYIQRVPVRPWQVRHESDNRVESERATFALDLARRGRTVAVVSSGDPGVFAMATAVLEVASEPAYRDIPVRIVPGMTAAHAAAARAGAPLGHDYATISLSDRLKPWDVIAGRLRHVVDADLVVALYNPASRSRRWQVEAMKDLLLELRPPSTPVVVARDVGGPAEQVRVMRLSDLPTEEVDMRTLLIVGSSQTQMVTRTPGGQPQVVAWTPRRYPD